MPPSSLCRSILPHAALFFGEGTFLPSRRASESPIAIACFRLVTFLPLRPDFNLPRLNSCISRFTSLPAEGEYFRREPAFDPALLEAFFDADFLVVAFFALVLLRELEAFFALLFFALVLLRALDFFAPEDFLALADFFFAAFFVAITILPRSQMVPRFDTVVWLSGNPISKCA
jgi:hypothetical protein